MPFNSSSVLCMELSGHQFLNSSCKIYFYCLKKLWYCVGGKVQRVDKSRIATEKNLETEDDVSSVSPSSERIGL